jgi:hypothetical protein
LEAYIGEFGGQPRVLVGLARRFHSSGWLDSVAQHLELFLPLLERWEQSHPMTQVRRWAREQIGQLNAEISTHHEIYFHNA